MLKLKETLTQNEITDLVVNSTPITFFPYIITPDDSYYKYLYDLGVELIFLNEPLINTSVFDSP